MLDRRRLLGAGLCLVATIGCKRHSTEATGPAGGDGLQQLAKLDRQHPKAGVIVVLGSSTAAGIGPSKPELAWVPRYRAHLAKHFPQFVVVNLAVGGYTTFHIQPTGYVPPRDRPRPVAGQNIDAALALKPHSIILNLPSNDQAAGHAWREQLENYERVAAAAAAAQVPLWVTTTQPRNFESTEQRRELESARDALRQRFGAKVTDFWSPLARPDGTIKPHLDAGDGTHVNDQGHALLAQAVIDAGIPEALLALRD